MCVAHKCYCKENGVESYNFLFPKMTHKEGRFLINLMTKFVLVLKLIMENILWSIFCKAVKNKSKAWILTEFKNRPCATREVCEVTK